VSRHGLLICFTHLSVAKTKQHVQHRQSSGLEELSSRRGCDLALYIRTPCRMVSPTESNVSRGLRPFYQGGHSAVMQKDFQCHMYPNQVQRQASGMSFDLLSRCVHRRVCQERIQGLGVEL
jgi:hypothetical protein